jgi:predicted alpha/beta superfamily hydrolase
MLKAALCVVLCLVSSALIAGEDLVGVTGTVEHHPNFTARELLPRNVDVWLPPSYSTDGSKRYPVVYMHDGQNLFDPAKSFIGVDWGADEAMTRLIAEDKIREAIVVGIWNTPHRTREYLPEKPLREFVKREEVFKELAEGGGTRLNVDDLLGDKYLEFVVTDLKPFIDKTYRTQPKRDNTFIMGSSAGALISLYAICEYPQVFGGAGSVSGHYPLGGGMLVDSLRCRLPDPRCHRLYFDFGTETLDKTYESYQWELDAAVADRGYTRGHNWLTCRFGGAEHSERAWRERIDIPLEFFLRKKQGRMYPKHWWAAIDDSQKPVWEILPQAAKPGEVILSKRNELGLLSNFAATPFTFRGKRYASLEGFWQAMKYPEGSSDPRCEDSTIEWRFTREQVEQMVGFDAKEAGDLASANMRKLDIDWVSFDCKQLPYRPRTPGEHYRLIVAATKAKVRQNTIVSSVLLSTSDLVLRPDHLQEPESPAAWRYFEILMQIRDELQR